MKVLLIAGHGNGDPGACALGYQEQILTREVVVGISKLIDIDVFDITQNAYQSFKKTHFYFKRYDYVLEVHFNAGVGDFEGNIVTTGVEMLVSPKLSITVNNDILNVVSSLGFKNRGIKYRTNLSNMNKCVSQDVAYGLLEVCFIDDKDDMNLYQLKKNEMINAIAEVLHENFNLSYKENEVEKMKEVKKELELLNEQLNVLSENLKNAEYEIQKLKKPMIYNYIDENMPDWARPTIQKLVDSGKLKGNENGLNLDESMLRILVILDRNGNL